MKETAAQDYLRKRGIYSAEVVKKFKIGFSNRSLAYIVPRTSELRQPLQELGIFNQQTGHEFFSGCVVIPIMDQDGIVTEMYGRKIDRRRKGTAEHLYLPGSHKGVWNADVFVSCDEIILTEAAIDALTFYVHGYKNVTFSFGVSGFTADHLQLMQEYKIKTVFIAYDNDPGGNNAALRLSEKLKKEGITCYRLRYPSSMDVNLYARKVTPADKSLAILFKDPLLMMDKTSSLAVTAKKPTTNEECNDDFPAVSDDSCKVDDVTEAAKEKNEPGATAESSLDEQPAPPDHDLKHKAAVKRKKNGIYMSIKDRDYRIRGLEKNKSYEVMKVSVRVACNGSYYIDHLDMIQDRQRRIFARNASDELEINKEIIKRDLSSLLLVLEEILEEDIVHTDETYLMTEGERRAALAYLKSPDLIERILSDFHTCGIVNEDTNLLIGYLSSLSRKFDDPLAIMFQSSPGSGKSTVMDAILGFVPEEDKRVYTYMTGQSLFYAGENDLKHKVLAIEEDEGAEKANYSLKTMQSEKRITITSTGTDPLTGRNKSFTTTVNGPVAIMSCTTKPFVEEELMLRFLGLGTDESRQQTIAVLERQRKNETIEGMLAKERARQIHHRHQNVQRLLQPVRVLNPYADRLTFPSTSLRTRRDQKKYLTLIRAIAFLFQYQRARKSIMLDGVRVEYIEVLPSDIKLAYDVCCDVMGRSLDELAPQTRNLLNMQVVMVREACERLSIKQSDNRYGQKDIREYTGWSAYQVKAHMSRLVELEYVYCHQGRNGRRYEYEMIYDGSGDDGKRFVLGISNIDVKREQLKG
ncbi:toprim domain-containing protein [candidate division CSSED10-310 bacterium]|uniref:Toprim domain-containing protein n=1 Tax=candidate division CSSED10-310 bacterium TaxID=2855610 RepID=A0ABV6YZL9_UNCC1